LLAFNPTLARKSWQEELSTTGNPLFEKEFLSLHPESRFANVSDE